MNEKVDHPKHYNQGKIEVIDVIEDWKLGFHLGNAVKYIGRSGHKDENAVIDIRKAIWYLERKVIKLERGDTVADDLRREPILWVERDSDK